MLQPNTEQINAWSFGICSAKKKMPLEHQKINAGDRGTKPRCAQMLMRMYLRYCERKYSWLKKSITCLERSGIKSDTLENEGEYHTGT
jgi:hypothetical protein